MLQGPKRYVDETFLRPSVHGLKRVVRIVTRTEGQGTKHQGTEIIVRKYMYIVNPGVSHEGPNLVSC
jgi:hypothetical protein